MHARPEHKHVLELHFATNEFQINAFSVFRHRSHQEPAEKVPSVHHMKVATENSRLALSLHNLYRVICSILEHSSAVHLEHLLRMFDVTVEFVMAWHEAYSVR